MKKIINVIQNKKYEKNPPVWIMRQAGRYLPEYREIRSNVKNFLELCYTPKLAAEVTLQPIRRFKMDAAIIFSDILVIPDALGVKVEFVKNEGPKLGEFDLNKLKINNIESHLKPVFEALEIVKSNLDEDTALIGFSGCPWTLACYMIEKGGSKNFEKTRQLALQNPQYFSHLIEILTNSIIQYLSLQIKAGADIVKIFDSWAGILPPFELRKWVIEPSKKIAAELKKLHPEIPIICFPRGIGANYLEFCQEVKCDVVALDQNIERTWVKNNLQQDLGMVVQGNLDNLLLAFGSKSEIEKEVLDILQKFANKPFIFNLGHGILPQTPIENLELVLNLVRKSDII